MLKSSNIYQQTDAILFFYPKLYLFICWVFFLDGGRADNSSYEQRNKENDNG